MVFFRNILLIFAMLCLATRAELTRDAERALHGIEEEAFFGRVLEGHLSMEPEGKGKGGKGGSGSGSGSKSKSKDKKSKSEDKMSEDKVKKGKGGKGGKGGKSGSGSTSGSGDRRLGSRRARRSARGM